MAAGSRQERLAAGSWWEGLAGTGGVVPPSLGPVPAPPPCCLAARSSELDWSPTCAWKSMPPYIWKPSQAATLPSGCTSSVLSQLQGGTGAGPLVVGQRRLCRQTCALLPFKQAPGTCATGACGVDERRAGRQQLLASAAAHVYMACLLSW